MFLRSSVDMGESAFRRLKLCRDGSHWLDTLSVSNSSSRNWNNWFVAMITSLNIVAKTFAKIAKMFARLLAMIIATRRRLVLILHLETKYAKMDCKNEIYAKNWIRSTWTAKVNSCKKVNGQSQPRSIACQRWRQLTWWVTSSDDGRWCQQVTWQWWCHLG